MIFYPILNVGGSDSDVQSNQGSTFYADAGFTYNKTTSIVGVTFLSSLSANPASAGTIRLANKDTINWKNAANSGDLGIGTSGWQNGNRPADAISSINASGFLSPRFIQNDNVVAITGVFSLAKTGTIAWRNNAGLGDLVLGINSSDQLVWAGAATIGTLIETTTHTPASSGDTGITGQIAWDSGFIYVCIATNSWKRLAIVHSGW
jgi:hypothetical protein